MSAAGHRNKTKPGPHAGPGLGYYINLSSYKTIITRHALGVNITEGDPLSWVPGSVPYQKWETVDPTGFEPAPYNWTG